MMELSVGVMSDSLSLPSYKDYPAGRPFVNTSLPSYTLTTRNTHVPCRTLPSKAFPESSSAAILSALMNLQEKIRKLELERGRTERSLHSLKKETSHTDLRSDTHKPTDTRERETSNQSEPNPGERRDHFCLRVNRCSPSLSLSPSVPSVLVTQLAAAEARCKLLDRQLEYMRKMVRNAEADRTTLLKRQVSLEMTRSAAPAPDSTHQAQLEKLELLEQEYQRLTRTQNHAERKIRELELKLLEEEHQRKLVQNQANQLQTGLEANRILIRSVSLSPRLPKARSTTREKKHFSKKPALQQASHTQPHYRLSLGDVPFVAGKSVGCSHSVRANVQSVLSLLKQHQPQLCNARVLSHTPLAQQANGSHSDSGSSSSCGEELSDLLLALQDELGHMSLEQQELVRQAEACVCEQERRGVEREQKALLRRMERKGEQISKLRRHQAQVKRFTRDARGQKQGGEVKVTTRSRSAGAVKVGPGDRSRESLTLLRDMRCLQTSLRPNQPQWSY
ncbi:centrosomal protein of 57 kDa isoform X2 [Salmo salar]|uniref:Centrosomal protein of 57 kDa isoform X2 n=1 Tax=Salmo salar TaxID=8030 RepID=A0A1S3NU62_SALSA|nr:centrosomal protein of 57 kDa isoform X2 [Salmo salar]|eukprot:XP_014018963.1 PREDICTED: centrosomal protein of 57 kDa-like isoform X2 [Salmo salar]